MGWTAVPTFPYQNLARWMKASVRRLKTGTAVWTITAAQSKSKYRQVSSGKDNVYFTRILKKKPLLPKKAFNKKTTNQPSSYKNLSPTQNTPKNQTVLQFSFFPKQIKGGKAALVNQLPLLPLKQSFYRCKKQYLTIYSFSFQQHWVHNFKNERSFLSLMELKISNSQNCFSILFLY